MQAGYKFEDNFIGNTTLMPYVAVQYANYDRLNDPMAFMMQGLTGCWQGIRQS